MTLISSKLFENDKIIKKKNSPYQLLGWIVNSQKYHLSYSVIPELPILVLRNISIHSVSSKYAFVGTYKYLNDSYLKQKWLKDY